MIKQVWVAQCDICGKTENARMMPYNEQREKCGIKMEGIPHSPFLTNEEKMKFAEKIVAKWNAWILKSGYETVSDV